MTYTECYMQKKAKDEPSNYEIVAGKMEKEDADTLKAMGTPAPAEIGWSLLGAGLGGGAGYLLSRRFRRDGSRRQRALDIVLGALAGLGGTQLALSMPGDEKSGLSLRQTMRADKLIGDKSNADNDKGQHFENPLAPNAVNVGLGIAGGVAGGWTAGNHGWYNPKTKEWKSISRALEDSRRLEAMTRPGAPLTAKEIEAAAAKGARLGKAYDVGLGTAAGAAGGYATGSVINLIRNIFTRGKTVGDYN